MEFFLPFTIDSLPVPISYDDKIMLIGSCFSQEVGNKLSSLKFDVLQNPTGIVYHPLNISAVINRCIKSEKYTEDDLHDRNGIYHSWMHHSEFSSPHKEEVLKKINAKLHQGHQFMLGANYLIITPATAFAYYLKENNSLVSNCHKAPSALFEKRLTTPELIASALLKSLQSLRLVNPKIKIICTISPVKHLKDGVINNNVSKAAVIQAIHALRNEMDDVYYFPSFEIMNDELRDYRFYKNDFAHPNETAIKYIFERFMSSCMSAETMAIANLVKEISDSLGHRVLFPGTPQHGKFIESILRKIDDLEMRFPFLKFDQEKNVLKTTFASE